MAAVVAAFWPVVGNVFVNWDDPAALVDNAALDAPDVVSWAFRTTHMSHYQPLSWLAWAAVRRWAGSGPSAHHAASLLLHALNAALVFVFARRMGSLARLGPVPARAAALVAALLFALHPLRVEPVAWASGFPYVLALAPLLACLIAYLEYAAGGRGIVWLAAALGFYGVSLLARAVSPALPVVLLGIDWMAGRLLSPRSRRRVVAEKLPFIALALAAALAEGSARRFASLEQVGPGARLSDAAVAPAIYVARTLAPIRLSPLRPLPLDPRTSWTALVGGVAFVGTVTAAAWKARRTRPELLLLWSSFLALLAPALGLAPSGVQVTADRYTYFPGVAVGLAAGAVLVRAWPQRAARHVLLSIAVLASVLLAIGSNRQALWWRDSVTLWTRAVELDPRNDVALYNLAAALAEGGDAEAAAGRYRQLLRLVPDHGPARRNLELIEAARLEREANARAASGRLTEAVSLYTAALELDPARLHSRVSRGVALVQLGRGQEALADLRAAQGSETRDPEVAGALAYALVQAGMQSEARRILEETLRASPEHVGVAHNLARLLATAEDRAVRDGSRAIALATAVVEATGGRDARALGTLAAAFAAGGRLAEARRTAARAATLARAAGQKELAESIEADARAYAGVRTARPRS